MIFVNVADLPWADHPFKCRWGKDFSPEANPDLSEQERRRRFAKFVLSKTPAELEACHYHRPDWHWASERAIEAYEAGEMLDLDTSCEIAERENQSECSAEALWSFSREPIFVNGEALGNGQHRVCAMKAAGVKRCLIET